MTCLVQMNLLKEAIAVATKVNLDIGVIANVVHATQLQSNHCCCQRDVFEFVGAEHLSVH